MVKAGLHITSKPWATHERRDIRPQPMGPRLDIRLNTGSSFSQRATNRVTVTYAPNLSLKPWPRPARLWPPSLMPWSGRDHRALHPLFIAILDNILSFSLAPSACLSKVSKAEVLLILKTHEVIVPGNDKPPPRRISLKLHKRKTCHISD